MPMHRRKSVQFSWLCSLISFTPIINVATKYIKLCLKLVYKGRGGIYRGIYVPLTLFGAAAPDRPWQTLTDPDIRGGYRGVAPLYGRVLYMLYAYAYCLDAIDMMTNTSDKYVWYESIVYLYITHSEGAYKGMVGGIWNGSPWGILRHPVAYFFKSFAWKMKFFASHDSILFLSFFICLSKRSSIFFNPSRVMDSVPTSFNNI